METPQSIGPLAAESLAPLEVSAGLPKEAEAVRFLRDTVLPALRRTGPRTLVSPVAHATQTGALRGLAHLSERHRRELLEFLETGLPASHRPPRVLVTLTSLIAQLPAPQAGTGRRLASPAR